MLQTSLSYCYPGHGNQAQGASTPFAAFDNLQYPPSKKKFQSNFVTSML